MNSFLNAITKTTNPAIWLSFLILSQGEVFAEDVVAGEYVEAVQRRVYVDKVVERVEFRRLDKPVLLSEVAAGDDDFTLSLESSLASYFSATWIWNAIDDPGRAKDATEAMGRKAVAVNTMAEILKDDLAKHHVKREKFPEYYVDYIFRHKIFYVAVGRKIHYAGQRAITNRFQEWVVREAGKWKFVDKQYDEQKGLLFYQIAAPTEKVSNRAVISEVREITTSPDKVVNFILPIR